MEKIIRKIVIILGILGAIVFYIYGEFYMEKKAREYLLQEEYNGIITKIEYVEGGRGLPDVTIGKTVFYFGSCLNRRIQIGDSIVKEYGSDTVRIYRKTDDDSYREIIIKCQY